MKTNRKLNGILAVALLALVLMGPSMATSKDDAASKDAAASKDDAATRPTAPPEPLKVAAVSTTGFGFSDAARGLKLTVDQVLEIVTDENLKNDEQSRTLALRKVIGQRFDFSKMAMHTLVNVWDRRSRKEQQQFTRLFRRLLEKSYMNIIESFQGGKVHFLSERVKGDYAFIKTNFVSADRTLAVHYKLKREGQNWRVYDFLVQGVSMVRNYRFQFTKVIRQESFQGLLQRLKEQTA
ncbi:MAG: ABC transporter substrate-binding protein [Nitrospinae bacterium]|nr:ABC transporter substrate-binding protein [Nitrospinota bacterium]